PLVVLAKNGSSRKLGLVLGKGAPIDDIDLPVLGTLAALLGMSPKKAEHWDEKEKTFQIHIEFCPKVGFLGESAQDLYKALGIVQNVWDRPIIRSGRPNTSKPISPVPGCSRSSGHWCPHHRSPRTFRAIPVPGEAGPRTPLGFPARPPPDPKRSWPP